MTGAELRIDRLGHRGDGVAEGPEGPIYAPFTLPGETVSGAVAGDRLAAPEIRSPSPERVAPPCPHFGRCGGCALQHASDAFLARWKADQIAAALAARGLETEIRPTETSPPGARRRVVLAAERAGRGARLGFHGRASQAVIPVECCPVARPEIVAALPALREAAALCAPRRKPLRLAVLASETGLDVAVEGRPRPDGALAARLARLAGEADFARLTVGGETVALARRPLLTFGPARVSPPPGGFAQATAEGEAALAAAVEEAVGPRARRVADLFAGSGAFALRLAARATVTAVEGEADALAALEAGWKEAGGLRPLRVERRDLFRSPLPAAELAGFDAAVFDPPRAGAAAQATALAASPVRRIAAVSCNPATFGRDARMLVDGGYRLLWARPVDQFRWSPHVELAAAFAR